MMTPESPVAVWRLERLRVFSYWPIWLIGCVALLGAGFVSAFAPRRRRARARSEVAWSGARAAIDTATISRDASAIRVLEAEQLLARAELIAAGRGGRMAARAASGHARHAERLWREASDE